MENTRDKPLIIVLGICFVVLVILSLLLCAILSDKVMSLKSEVKRISTNLESKELNTVADCKQQIAEASMRKWDLVKGRWVKVSDMNDAVWYVGSYGYSFKFAAWDKLIEEKSEAGIGGIELASAWEEPKRYDIAITYQLSESDLVKALKEAVEEPVDSNMVFEAAPGQETSENFVLTYE